MIMFRKDLYLSESAGKEKTKIIRNIRKHKLQFGVYVISLCINGKDIFDIIPSYMLDKDGYKGRDIKILGIAMGREESFELAGEMILDAFSASSPESADIRGYFA